MIDLIKTEPVAFQAIVQAGLGLFLSFGVGLTVEQMGAILAFTATVLAFFTRKAVTPTVKQ